jgi:arabinofuranan 3-O-arabinosyltransferase
MLTNPGLVVKIARTWVVVAGLAYAADMLRTKAASLTDVNGRPLGDDFVNYWTGAYLAWHGRSADVYNWPAYRGFLRSIVGDNVDPYFYGYPPVLLVLTVPLAVLPYLPGLGVWLVSSWLCFYRALALAMPGRNALLLALATPAVFVNAYGGQNGVWTAALFGGALCLIDRRPFVAGLLFGLMTYKPHLGLLIPVALLAGRQWRAIAGAIVSSGLLFLASLLLFGPEIWRDFLHIVGIQRQVILENGTGIWHRMLSIFMLARQLGADVQVAYAAQAMTGLIAAGIVALAWLRDVPAPIRNASLVLGTFFVTPYLQDYDTVVFAFVAVWLMSAESLARIPERHAMIAAGALLLVPLLNAPLSQFIGLPLGALMIAPAFWLTARMVVGAQALPAPAVR